MSDCPTIIQIGDPAVSMAETLFSSAQSFARQGFSMAREQVGDLRNFSITTPSLGTSFTVNFNDPGYQRPLVPETPDISLGEFEDPGAAPEFEFEPVQFVSFPADTTVSVPYVQPPQPGGLSVTRPGSRPTLVPPTFPDDLDLEFPDSPTLLDITVPDAPPEIDREFEGIRPSNDIPIPTENWSFTPTEYSSDLLTAVGDRITAMLAGGTGLPAAVAQALRDRAYAEVDREESRGIDQATVEFTSRGFDEPNGVLEERVRRARFDGTSKRSAINRDIFIEEQKEALLNLRFAVQQGIAYEGMLIQHHLAIQGLILDALKFARDTAIAIFNARVALYSAQMEGYKADAQVFRDLIQADLARVEIFKAEIEAQKLIGDLNRQTVEIYAAEIRAVLGRVEVYNAQVNAARAWAENNVAIMEGYRAEVQAYAEYVRAYVAEWEAFSKRIEGEVAKQQAYKVSVDAFIAKVGAVAAQNQNLIEQKRLELQVNETEVRVWQADLQRALALLQAERERVSAEAQVFGTQAALYQAQAGVERTVSEVAQRNMTIAIEAERGRVDAELKQAEIAINEGLRRADILLRAIEGAANTSAQLAGAALSAGSASATVARTSSKNESAGCTTSYNYSGEID